MVECCSQTTSSRGSQKPFCLVNELRSGLKTLTVDVFEGKYALNQIVSNTPLF